MAAGDIGAIFGLVAVSIKNVLDLPAVVAGSWAFLKMAWPGLDLLVTKLGS